MVISMFVSVCEDIAGTTSVIFTKFLCMFLNPWLSPPPACWRQAALPICGKGVTGVHSADKVNLQLPCYYTYFVPPI